MAVNECNSDISPVTTPQRRTGKISQMKWVPLYALTALVTGLHNFYGLMSKMCIRDSYTDLYNKQLLEEELAEV